MQRPSLCLTSPLLGAIGHMTTSCLNVSVLGSRSSSRDRKRGRWEEERERRSESSSGLSSRERGYSSARSRDSEEAPPSDRDRERERGEDEKDEQQLLKPAWIRCTHAENNYSNDPMDQVVRSRLT